MPLLRTLPVAASVLLLATACAEKPKNEAAEQSAAVSSAPATTGETMGVSADSASPVAAGGAMLDPNTASRDELMTLPGVTAASADALIAGRPYANMTGVDGALGAMDKPSRAALYARLWKPIALNSATDAEIKLIPGVGDRMLHEFKEYRPYKSMEQFRRQIGKYVNREELARLERYVEVP